jgi:hypothetical protein
MFFVSLRREEIPYREHSISIVLRDPMRIPCAPMCGRRVRARVKMGIERLRLAEQITLDSRRQDGYCPVLWIFQDRECPEMGVDFSSVNVRF